MHSPLRRPLQGTLRLRPQHHQQSHGTHGPHPGPAIAQRALRSRNHYRLPICPPGQYHLGPILEAPPLVEKDSARSQRLALDGARRAEPLPSHRLALDQGPRRPRRQQPLRLAGRKPPPAPSPVSSRTTLPTRPSASDSAPITPRPTRELDYSIPNRAKTTTAIPDNPAPIDDFPKLNLLGRRDPKPHPLRVLCHLSALWV